MVKELARQLPAKRPSRVDRWSWAVKLSRVPPRPPRAPRSCSPASSKPAFPCSGSSSAAPGRGSWSLRPLSPGLCGSRGGEHRRVRCLSHRGRAPRREREHRRRSDARRADELRSLGGDLGANFGSGEATADERSTSSARSGSPIALGRPPRRGSRRRRGEHRGDRGFRGRREALHLRGSGRAREVPHRQGQHHARRSEPHGDRATRASLDVAVIPRARSRRRTWGARARGNASTWKWT